MLDQLDHWLEQRLDDAVNPAEDQEEDQIDEEDADHNDAQQQALGEAGHLPPDPPQRQAAPRRRKISCSSSWMRLSRSTIIRLCSVSTFRLWRPPRYRRSRPIRAMIPTISAPTAAEASTSDQTGRTWDGTPQKLMGTVPGFWTANRARPMPRASAMIQPTIATVINPRVV